MPIITIKSLPIDEDEMRTPDILKKVCTAVALRMNYQPNHVWATWEFISPHLYTTGNYSVGAQPQSTHAPLVRIISFEGKSKRDIEAIIQTVAETLSSELKIDIANVFIEYTEAKSGKIFDGGQIIY
jgi:phenylpyruvate tautomerase PptA (4-oxalocrotonate tautomerase family)